MSELTHPQTQQGGIILSDPHLELRTFCDGLRNPVVDATVKLEDNQIVFFLIACVCDKPENQSKHMQYTRQSRKMRAVYVK